MILLQNGFDLPEIKERNLKGRKKGTGNLGEYHPDSKIIYINNHPIIKEMGGLRKIMQNEVVKGRAVQDNVVLHELAHYIDQIINPGFDSPQHSYRVFLNREYVKEQLSEYAYTNRSEFEAELISGILRGKVYPKEILDYADISKLDNEKAKHILALGNGTIPNDSGLPREFDKMTETVYKNPEKDAAVLLTDSDVRKFIERQKLIFDNAVDTSLKEVPLDDISVQRLKESNYVFSGIKTFHELNETFPSLLDEEGNRKPFNQFLNDVQKVYDAYNVQYLRAEYNFAQASALMAARWKQFEQDGDRYNLQYRTMYDKRVRRTHRMLHNITLPIESPFWDKYFPPNGWNCRCTVVQVRKDKYPVSNEQEAMNLGSQATAGKYQEMFMFNPGKRMTTFPAYNGYTLRKCNRCEVRPDKMKLAADIPDNEVCRVCRMLQESRLAGIHSATEGIRSIIRRLENGYPKGDAVRIGRLADDVKEFVRKKGIEPSTDEIYMTDKQIHHALRSVKQKAGKSVTAEQLAALPSLMDDSEVYWDEKAGNIQFITRQDGKIQKFVVSLNYAAKIQGEKKTVNAFITAGTIEERNLGMKNLVKIK